MALFEHGPLAAAKEYFGRFFEEALTESPGSPIRNSMTASTFFPVLGFSAARVADCIEILEVIVDENYEDLVEDDPAHLVSVRCRLLGDAGSCGPRDAPALTLTWAASTPRHRTDGRGHPVVRRRVWPRRQGRGGWWRMNGLLSSSGSARSL